MSFIIGNMAKETRLFTSGLGSDKTNAHKANRRAPSESTSKADNSTYKKQKDPKQPNSKLKLIVVEDDAVIGSVLTLKLKSEGFTVDSASDGSEGIELIKKNKYDLIILDLIMPVMDGFEVLEKLNENKNKVPVIVMSNLGQQEDIERAKSLGAKDYLIKANTPLNKIVEYITNTF